MYEVGWVGATDGGVCVCVCVRWKSNNDDGCQWKKEGDMAVSAPDPRVVRSSVAYRPYRRTPVLHSQQS